MQLCGNHPCNRFLVKTIGDIEPHADHPSEQSEMAVLEDVFIFLTNLYVDGPVLLDLLEVDGTVTLDLS